MQTGRRTVKVIADSFVRFSGERSRKRSEVFFLLYVLDFLRHTLLHMFFFFFGINIFKYLLSGLKYYRGLLSDVSVII